MRPQKVSVDSWYMLTVSCGCIGLIIAVRVLLRLIQAIFWLPGYIEKMEKAMAEEQVKLKIIEDKESMQDPELDKEKADAKVNDENEANEENEEILANGVCEEKPEEFEELTSEDPAEEDEYMKNKND